MLCVECGSPVDRVYREYGPNNIRLTICKQCGNKADKYVECDFVIIFLDLLLLRAPVFRHLLHNRLQQHSSTLTRTWYKIAIVYILVEAYLRYMNLKNYYGTKQWKGVSPVDVMPQDRYFFIFYTVCFEFVLFLATQWLVARFLYRPKASELANKQVWIAILASSFIKPLQLFLTLWDHPPFFDVVLSIFVLISNFFAVAVLLENVPKALLVLIIAILTRVTYRVLMYRYDPLFLLTIM
ncbi:hypothetical protein QOT17_003169 [Balamuthia mandrillaris]